MKEYYPIMIILFGLVKSQVLISHHRCSASEEALQNSEAKMQTLLESIIQTKSDSQRVCKDEIEALKEEMREENEILKREVERMKNAFSLANDHKDCLWYKITNENATSGVYDLKVGTREFSAYCDMETDGGGWTAVLSRYTNTSVDFQRTWNEYKKGFGNISESYWIGNDIFHELTEGRPSEMYFLMHPYYSPYVGWQKYKHVTVQSEELNYRLNFDENSFQGNRRNLLGVGDDSANNGSFGTYDLGNYCSNRKGGGWWYKHSNYCGYSMTSTTHAGFWGMWAIKSGKQNLMMVRYEYK